MFHILTLLIYQIFYVIYVGVNLNMVRTEVPFTSNTLYERKYKVFFQYPTHEACALFDNKITVENVESTINESN